jgi:6-phosphogluconate dehydrogenase (decarboxylating)
MQIGMIGLRRTGSNMVRRLMGAGHRGVVYTRHAEFTEFSGRVSGSGKGR